MSAESKVLYDGSLLSYLNDFLSYFKNVAEDDSSSEIRDLSLIEYLRGCAFQFYCQMFARNCEVDEEARF